MDIEELDLSVRAYHCLKRAGIDTVEQLRQKTDDELFRIRNISKRCIEEIRQKVSAPGKTNADHIRSMSDEELAHEIMCPYQIEPDMCNSVKTCNECCLDWLKQPYKEEQ